MSMKKIKVINFETIDVHIQSIWRKLSLVHLLIEFGFVYNKLSHDYISGKFLC